MRDVTSRGEGVFDLLHLVTEGGVGVKKHEKWCYVIYERFLMEKWLLAAGGGEKPYKVKILGVKNARGRYRAAYRTRNPLTKSKLNNYK